MLLAERRENYTHMYSHLQRDLAISFSKHNYSLEYYCAPRPFSIELCLIWSHITDVKWTILCSTAEHNVASFTLCYAYRDNLKYRCKYVKIYYYIQNLTTTRHIERKWNRVPIGVMHRHTRTLRNVVGPRGIHC